MPDKERITLNELEDMLFEIDEDALTIPELHGFLSAVIIGPEVVPPGVWLSYVFNSEGEMPVFSSIEEANDVCGIVINYYNQIIHDMDTDTYVPVFSIKRRNNKDVLDPVSWCFNFAEGVLLTEEAWLSEEDETLDALMLPIYYFVNPEEFGSISRYPSGRKRRGFDQQMMELIPRSVLSIRNYWREKSYGSEETQRKGRIIPFNQNDQKEPGRNVPCPCGSGKKYKFCCGKEE